jgi:hypothetical protein
MTTSTATRGRGAIHPMKSPLAARHHDLAAITPPRVAGTSLRRRDPAPRADISASQPPDGRHRGQEAPISFGRLAEAQAVAAPLITAGQRVSRRTLRAGGLHGSNTELGTLARFLGAEHRPPDPPH